MLGVILFLPLIGVLVGGNVFDTAATTDALRKINGNSRRRSRTTLSPIDDLHEHSEEHSNGETFMSARLGVLGRKAWEAGFDALLTHKHDTATAPIYQQCSQQVHGGEILYDGLRSYLSNLQTSPCFLYILYYHTGTIEDQLKSCFYIGTTTCIRNRLMHHKKASRKENLAKFKRFRDDRNKFIGICELYQGSIGDCELLEKMMVSQDELLGLKLVNIVGKQSARLIPDPEQTTYFQQLMVLGLKFGQKFESETVSYTDETQAKINRRRQTLRAKNPAKYREVQRKNLLNYSDEKYEQYLKRSSESNKKYREKKFGQKVTGVRAAYIWYQKETIPQIRKEQIGRFSLPAGEHAKECGRRWKALTKEQKQPYIDKQEEDKLRYQKELAANPGYEKVIGVRDAFSWYQKEMKPKIRQEHGEQFSMTAAELTKECRRLWKAMSKEQRQSYVDKQEEDKIRYQNELAVLSK